MAARKLLGWPCCRWWSWAELRYFSLFHHGHPGVQYVVGLQVRSILRPCLTNSLRVRRVPLHDYDNNSVRAHTACCILVLVLVLHFVQVKCTIGSLTGYHLGYPLHCISPHVCIHIYIRTHSPYEYILRQERRKCYVTYCCMCTSINSPSIIPCTYLARTYSYDT